MYKYVWTRGPYGGGMENEALTVPKIFVRDEKWKRTHSVETTVPASHTHASSDTPCTAAFATQSSKMSWNVLFKRRAFAIQSISQNAKPTILSYVIWPGIRHKYGGAMVFRSVRSSCFPIGIRFFVVVFFCCSFCLLLSACVQMSFGPMFCVLCYEKRPQRNLQPWPLQTRKICP